tara:strand:- start:2266 stop:3072 length:807 start_codon:yes stop_codon:yes gene_type:complete
MQLSALRTQVRDIVDITSSDISDTVMNNLIREGYDTIVYSEKRWPFYEVALQFDTVGGQKDYSMADVATNLSITHDGVTFSGGSAPKNVGLREIASLKSDSQVIEFIGYDTGDVIYPLNSNSTGNPWYWSMWASGSSASAGISNQTIRIYPTPGSGETIYLRGYRNPVEFGGNTAIARTAIADTDTPDLPVPFDNVLSLYVIYRCYQQQEDAAMGQQYYSQFIQELANLRARFEDSPAPQPILLNSVRSSRWLSQSYLPDRLRYSWEW